MQQLEVVSNAAESLQNRPRPFFQYRLSVTDPLLPMIYFPFYVIHLSCLGSEQPHGSHVLFHVPTSNRIRYVEPWGYIGATWRLASTTELVLPWAHPSPQPKRQIARFSHFCTAHGRKSLHNGRPSAPFLQTAPTHGDLDRHLTHDYLDQSEPITEAASQSVQPFLHTIKIACVSPNSQEPITESETSEISGILYFIFASSK